MDEDGLARKRLCDSLFQKLRILERFPQHTTSRRQGTLEIGAREIRDAHGAAQAEQANLIFVEVMEFIQGNLSQQGYLTRFLLFFLW